MKDNQLSKITVALIISVALFFDLVQALLDLLAVGIVINTILSIPIFMTFWLWFKLHNIHFNTAKRALTMGSGFIVELIPVINFLPAWTAAVVLVILSAKIPKIAQIATGGAQGTSNRGEKSRGENSRAASQKVIPTAPPRLSEEGTGSDARNTQVQPPTGFDKRKPSDGIRRHA